MVANSLHSFRRIIQANQINIKVTRTGQQRIKEIKYHKNVVKRKALVKSQIETKPSGNQRTPSKWK